MTMSATLATLQGPIKMLTLGVIKTSHYTSMMAVCSH
jgi:hypothetical protein